MRAVRHIVRVEWVTDQVRWRNGSGGGGKVSLLEEEGVVVVYLEGRRIVGGMVGVLVGGLVAVLVLYCVL